MTRINQSQSTELRQAAAISSFVDGGCVQLDVQGALPVVVDNEPVYHQHAQQHPNKQPAIGTRFLHFNL